MELQIVDVDGFQVQPSGLQNTHSWVEEVRGNTRLLEETGAYDFLEVSFCSRGVACYVVALWCRSSCGQSICILVCDATRRVYKRLREDSARNKAFLEDICRTLPDHARDLVSCEVLYLRTTNGWRCEDQDPHVAKAFPWLRVSVVNASQLRNVSCDSSGSCGQWLQQHREHFEEHFQEGEDAQKKKHHVVSAQEKLDLRTEVLQATGLKPGGWLKLTPELERRLFSTPRAPKVWCSASLQVRTEELRGLALPEKMAMAPLRVLSFDIECVSQEDGFPLASNREDAVICIGLYCKALGEDDSSAICKMLCLGETAALPESTARTEVLCFELESELLAAFGAELSRMDADVVAGYNTCLFDWSYLATRIEAVHRLSDRTKYSRRKEVKTPPKQQTLSSGAMGDNPLCYPRMPGRVNFDLWLYLKRENIGGLENLKLNTISKHFLNDAKVDLPAKEMFRCYREGAAGRAKVAHYCRQDCKLVLDLLEKVEALPSVWEMAKITCTSPEDILFRGQQIKVYTQLVLKANEVGYLVEDKPLAEEEEKHDEGFQGATVVTPTPGYYLEPVFCLDFASLYPSLMRTYNLSPECLLPPALRTRQEVLSNEIHVDGARSHRFIRSSVHEGLLPRILEQLLSERKRVKKLMDQEDDPKVRSLLNRKQLALKISANSVYGACGSTKGKLSCVECAEATTSAGRSAIDFTCSYVNRLPGFQIIYGDTDSAFCRLPSELKDASMQELFERGEELASEITGEITKLFPGEKCHIKLEFEKVFHPLILYKKKRYAGLCCENPEKPSKIMARGLELVRRDACQLVKDTQKKVIDLLLQKKDLEGSAHAMLDALRSILEIPLGGPFQVIKQSKSLKQSYHDEESQVQCVVRSLMRQRESGSEPRVGDRVEYVVVASTSQRVVDKCEDVCFAERQGLPPDWLHYLEAVERPLKAILEVPLASLRPTLLRHLEGVCRELKQKAGGLVAKHCMARKGVIWRSGHLSKDGRVQSKLDSCFAPPRPRGAAEPLAAEDAVGAAGAAAEEGTPSSAANDPRRGGASSSSRAASSTATLTRPHATSFSYEEAPSAAVLKGAKRQKTKELLAAKTAVLDTYFGNKKCYSSSKLGSALEGAAAEDAAGCAAKVPCSSSS